MSQYPAEAEGVFAVVLIYTIICLLCNFLLLWLVWTHNEKLSYVALIGYFTLLSTIASTIKQIYIHTWWIDFMTATHRNAVAHASDSGLLATTSFGVIKVVSIIQNYCYVVETTLVLFWAFTLTQSVYGWLDHPRSRVILLKVNIAGKFISCLLPILQIGLQEVVAIRRSYVGYMVVCNTLFAISCVGGAIFLLMIFWKYVDTRRRFTNWNVGYGKSSSGTGRGSYIHLPHRTSIYDRWLITRFTLTFVFMCAIEACLVLFQVTSQRANLNEAFAHKPDISASRARSNAAFTAPGVTGSLVAFIVFGTTQPLRKKMYQTFVPKRFQRSEPIHSRAHPYGSANNASGGHRRNNSDNYEPQKHDVVMDDFSQGGSVRYHGKTSDDEMPIFPPAKAVIGDGVV